MKESLFFSYLCIAMVMHIGDIKALAQRAHRDERFRDGLFAAMYGDDLREARNAAWALTHLPKEDTIYYIDTRRAELTAFAISTPDTSLRRLSLVLLERLEWGRETLDDECYVRLLDFCMEHMLLPDEPYGIKALCMKLAYQQCRHYPELCAELKQCLLLMEPSELGAGVKHTRGKILKLL